MMLTIIAYSALFIAVITSILAATGFPRLYWITAICIYTFSLIAGFSIGQFTVGLTVVPLAMAVGHALSLIKRRSHAAIWAGSGLVVGALLVAFVDDYWLFYPVTFLV